MTQKPAPLETSAGSIEDFPSQLVVLLYDQALASLGAAIDAISKGEIEARCRATEEVAEVIHLLHQSLDMENGGVVAQNLDQIYTLIITQLPVLNLRNDAQIAHDLVQLLMPLRDSWAELDARIRHDVEEAEAALVRSIAPPTAANDTGRFTVVAR